MDRWRERQELRLADERSIDLRGGFLYRFCCWWLLFLTSSCSTLDFWEVRTTKEIDKVVMIILLVVLNFCCFSLGSHS